MFPKRIEFPYKLEHFLPLVFFIILASFPILGIKHRSILIILCLASFLFSLFIQRRRKAFPNKLYTIYFSLPAALFILYAISYFYSTNEVSALFSLEKRLSLIAFPIMAWISTYLPTSRRLKLYALWVFIFSCLFLLIKSLIYVETNQLFSFSADSWQSVTSLRRAISSAIGLHPTYASIYFLFSCLILVDFGLQSFQRDSTFFSFNILLYLLLFFIFLSMAFIMAARTPLFSFVASLFVLLLSEKGSTILKSSLAILVLFGVVIATFSIPSLNHRIKEVFNTEWKAPEGIHYNSTNIRIAIYQCSLESIGTNWLIGAGAGDSQAELNKCYRQFSTSVFEKSNYNTHNQYLGIWLDIGIIGLFTFLAFFLYGLYSGYLWNDSLQISFFIFMAINMLTENILATQAGIVFLMYFYTFFLIQKQKKTT